jgi:hypothetical protein
MNKSGVRAKKTRVARKANRGKARKKVSPTRKRVQRAVSSDIEAVTRVKESIENYHRGDTMGFATVDEIWKFAESDQ